MKLSLLQENLAKAISQASRFASTRSQLPILGNILLRTNKTKLNISSTNLEISVSINIIAKIEEEGEISIPAKVIYDLVNNLPHDLVTLESDKEQLKVSVRGFSSKILGANASDFPKIPGVPDGNTSIMISKKQLTEALPRVIFSTSVDETRPILTGVLFILEKGALTLVSTDGFRLSRKRLKTDSLTESKVVIPKGILTELLKTSEDTDEILVSIQEKDKQVVFGINEIALTSRILEGDYPDFEKIIPKSSNIVIRMDKNEFMQAVKVASVFAREASNIIKLKIFNDYVLIGAESGTSGSQETKVDLKVDKSESEIKNWEIAFNYRFLEEFLHSVVGEEIKIEFTTGDKAGVFVDPKDVDYLHLIMPVRIQV